MHITQARFKPCVFCITTCCQITVTRHARAVQSIETANILCEVQVTSDGVPVIFHDDYVVHGSLVAPKRTLISELTLAQFKSLGPLLRRSKCVETQEVQPHDNVWICEHEDSMPELVDVLEKLPEVRLQYDFN